MASAQFISSAALLSPRRALKSCKAACDRLRDSLLHLRSELCTQTVSRPKYKQ